MAGAPSTRCSLGWGAAALAGLLAGCTHSEGLEWPTPPVGAQSILIVSLAEDGPVVIAQAGVGPSAFSVGPGPVYLIYTKATLAELAIEEGQLPRGNGRALPEALATFEKLDARWEPLALGSADPRLAAVRFAAPDRATCLSAGGCYGLGPDPEQCNLPCPCAKAPLSRQVYPHNECPLPEPRAEACYQRRGPLAGLLAPGALDALGSVVAEDGEWILYFSTDRFSPGTPKLARAELEASIAVRPESIAVIELGLGPTVAQERPHVRVDGLELYFHARTSTAAKYELWMATRPRLGAPFVRPRRVHAKPNSDLLFPVLLGDFRTLLYRAADLAAVAAVRTSTFAGDLGFTGHDVGFSLAPEQGAYWVNTGCDRQSVLYVRTVPQPYVLTIASLSTLAPLATYPAFAAQRQDGTPFLTGDVEDISFVETPDCRHLLFSVPGNAEVYDTVPCAR